MLTPYIVSYEFYYDGQRISRRGDIRLLEAPLEEEYFGSTFEDLWNFLCKWGDMVPLGMYEPKIGKKFIQHYNALFRCITEKNCKPWRFVISSKETTISMKELMGYDTETVIQYLKERGITTCPIMK